MALFLIVFSVFGGYRLHSIVKNRTPVTLEYATLPTAVVPVIGTTTPVKPAEQAHTYVASRTGQYYYLPSCSGSKRIAEKNKVWFATETKAKEAGFKPAKACAGLSQ